MSFSQKNALLCLLFISLMLPACEDDPVPPPEPPVPLTFAETCCAEPALNELVSGKNVYLANVFTPNGDGINDFAMVFAEEGTEIDEFTIFKNDTVYFSKVNFLPNDPNFGWDGLIGTEYRNDYFNYSLSISGKTFQGTVSSWRCEGDSSVVIPDNVLECQFPTQWSGNGYDAGLPSFEDCDG